MVNNAYNKNGATMVGGKKYQLTVGSRAQVYNGTAYKTGYGRKGLKKSDLIKNKHGRIVSRKKHAYGKRKGLKQLHAKGYFTRKGKFGAIKKGKTAKKSRKRGKSRGKRCRHKSGKKKGKYKKCKTKKRR
jgi:hypothetical protein